HWLAVLAVSCVRSCVLNLAQWTGWRSAHPSTLPLSKAPPDKGSDVASRTRCRCKWCRWRDTFGIGTLAHRCAWCGGTIGHLAQEPYTCRLGGVSLVHGSALLSIGCIAVGLAGLLL